MVQVVQFKKFEKFFSKVFKFRKKYKRPIFKKRYWSCSNSVQSNSDLKIQVMSKNLFALNKSLHSHTKIQHEKYKPEITATEGWSSLKELIWPIRLIRLRHVHDPRKKNFRWVETGTGIFWICKQEKKSEICKKKLLKEGKSNHIKSNRWFSKLSISLL